MCPPSGNKCYQRSEEQKLPVAPAERFFVGACTPGALPQAVEAMGFQPADGAIILTLHNADDCENRPYAKGW